MAASTLHPVMAKAVTRWRALGLRCVICDGRIESGGVVLLGREPHHRGCAVTAAAGIASEVIEGDDSYTARDVQAAASILADAARVLNARVGGRA